MDHGPVSERLAGLLAGDEGITTMHSLRKDDLEIRRAEYEIKRSTSTAGEKRSEEALQIQRDELEIKRNRATAEGKKLEAETEQIHAAIADRAKDRGYDQHYKLLRNRQKLRDQNVPLEEIDLLFPLPLPK
jgi:hypothetical protein